LRPKTTQLANTRLFFGVEQETKAEKSKSGYDSKVGHIGLLQQKGKNLMRVWEKYFSASNPRYPYWDISQLNFHSAGLAAWRDLRLILPMKWLILGIMNIKTPEKQSIRMLSRRKH